MQTSAPLRLIAFSLQDLCTPYVPPSLDDLNHMLEYYIQFGESETTTFIRDEILRLKQAGCPRCQALKSVTQNQN